MRGKSLKNLFAHVFHDRANVNFPAFANLLNRFSYSDSFFSGDENSRLFLCENENFIFALLLLLSHAIFSVLCFSYVMFYLNTHHTAAYYSQLSCGEKSYIQENLTLLMAIKNLIQLFLLLCLFKKF